MDILRNINSCTSIAFTITNKCNLKCSHCYNRSGDNNFNDLSNDELIKIAKQIKQIKPLSTCICGGEPLIREDVLYDIIKILNETCGNVSMVTNGFLLNEKKIKRLKESGLKLIQFSLDGSNEFQHDNFRGVKGAFKKVINAITLSKKENLKTSISTVPNIYNIEYIEDIINMIFELGADEFRIMPFIPMGRGSSSENLLINSDDYIKLQQLLIKMKLKWLKKDKHIEWGDPVDHLYRMPNNAQLGYCSYAIDIRSDGKIQASTYLPIVIGDLLENDLSYYWNNGLSNYWKNRNILKYTTQIKNIYDFNKFYEYPYHGKDINVKLDKAL